MAESSHWSRSVSVKMACSATKTAWRTRKCAATSSGDAATRTWRSRGDRDPVTVPASAERPLERRERGAGLAAHAAGPRALAHHPGVGEQRRDGLVDRPHVLRRRGPARGEDAAGRRPQRDDERVDAALDRGAAPRDDVLDGLAEPEDEVRRDLAGPEDVDRGLPGLQVVVDALSRFAGRYPGEHGGVEALQVEAERLHARALELGEPAEVVRRLDLDLDGQAARVADRLGAAGHVAGAPVPPV